tara:strand:- start:716 stop:964 length:249 start_codon:yes stop_codon:yes gene_type:complete
MLDNLSGRHPNKCMMKPRVEYLEKFPNWKWGKQQRELQSERALSKILSLLTQLAADQPPLDVPKKKQEQQKGYKVKKKLQIG